MRKSTRNQKGFSLIELLIVVAIILIIAAIAIPNLMNSKRTASESAAAANMRTVVTANVQYQQAYPTTGYAPTLTALGPGDGTGASATQANLLDAGLGCAAAPCVKSGYSYTYATANSGADTTAANDEYMVLASPISQTDGKVWYCTDESGMIKKSTTKITAAVAVKGCGGGTWVGLGS